MKFIFSLFSPFFLKGAARKSEMTDAAQALFLHVFVGSPNVLMVTPVPAQASRWWPPSKGSPSRWKAWPRPAPHTAPPAWRAPRYGPSLSFEPPAGSGGRPARASAPFLLAGPRGAGLLCRAPPIPQLQRRHSFLPVLSTRDYVLTASERSSRGSQGSGRCTARAAAQGWQLGRPRGEGCVGRDREGVTGTVEMGGRV